MARIADKNWGNLHGILGMFCGLHQIDQQAGQAGNVVACGAVPKPHGAMGFCMG